MPFKPPRGLRTLPLLAKALFQPVIFGVVGLVEDDSGRILLVRHSYSPGWQLPGGGVGRGEAPAAAILRELREEVGLSDQGSAELFGLYSQCMAWGTNVIAVYHIRGATIHFRPNLEIREVLFCDPAAPPSETTPATQRRLAEFRGAARSEQW